MNDNKPCRQELMNRINAASFAVDDVKLFLDTHPCDKEAMEYFEKYYDRFEKKEDLGDLKEEYERLLVNKGKQVRVLEPGREHTGTALGISSQGELLVELEDGSIEKVYAGEVSVRGVYGYV